MQNCEKFKEVFGFEPDEYCKCPYPSTECIEQGAICAMCDHKDWWHQEFKPIKQNINKDDE